MSELLLLPYPTLQDRQQDFAPDVSHSVSVQRKLVGDNGKVDLIITHTLSGQSFLSDWIRNGQACFSVLLRYVDSAQREAHRLEQDDVHGRSDGLSLQGVQQVPQRFSRPPVVMPFIVSTCASSISAGAKGLVPYWNRELEAGPVAIGKWTRLAFHSPIHFVSGRIDEWIVVKNDRTLNKGEIRTGIELGAAEPVVLYAADDAYGELRRLTSDQCETMPDGINQATALRRVMITQALVALYAHVNHAILSTDERDFASMPLGETLRKHLEEMHKKTGMQLGDERFNASLAATRMMPFLFPAGQGD